MNQGQCPKCKAVIQSVKAEQITCEQPAEQQSLQGVSYLCPSCHAVLGIHIAHASLQEEALKSL
jgi:uncharacterized protein with PIN domain